MKWVVRIFLLAITLVFLVLAAAAYMLATFNPNDYKAQIASAVTNATGRPFAINGDIKATMFPVLGFTAQSVEMGSPAGFADAAFLKVGSLQAGVKVRPLLDKKIELTKITLTEPAINIVKLANGKTNMEFTRSGEAKVKTAADAPDMDLSVEEVQITRARVIYTDKAKGESWTIDPLNMTLPGFKPGANTNIRIDMAMKRGDDLTVRVNASAAMNAAPAAGTFTLSGAQADINVTAPALARDAAIKLRGDMALDTKNQTAEGKDIKLSWQGTNITSSIKITNFKTPKVSFTATAPTLDMDSLTAAFAKKEKAANDNKDLMPFDLLRTLGLDGTIRIDTLKMAGLTATTLNAKINAANGQLKIAPVTGNLYEGTLSAAVTIDARNNTPSLAAKADLKDIQVGPVLAAKAGDDYLTGKAAFAMDLQSRGRTMTALRNAAGGTFGFDFGEGYINKWQLSKRINQAIAYFETGTLSENVPDKIHFTSLDGKFTGQNGVFRNSDLVLLAPRSHALGGGTVNFAQNIVDYTVRVGLGDDPEKLKDSRHIPVRISGPLNKPQYGLDVQALVGQKVEEKKQELLNKAFEKLSGQDKKTTTPEGAAPAAPDTATPAPETPAPQKKDPREELLKGILGGL